jgi:hypothetical protein
MVLVDFGSSIGLVWIIGLSLVVSSIVLYGATTLVLYGATTLLCGATTFVLCEATTLILCGAITLVLCGTRTLVLYGTHHPMWLSFYLIGWFGLWLGFGLSSGDNLGQGCEATIWVVWFAWQPSILSPLMN